MTPRFPCHVFFQFVSNCSFGPFLVWRSIRGFHTILMVSLSKPSYTFNVCSIQSLFLSDIQASIFIVFILFICLVQPSNAWPINNYILYYAIIHPSFYVGLFFIYFYSTMLYIECFIDFTLLLMSLCSFHVLSSSVMIAFIHFTLTFALSSK